MEKKTHIQQLQEVMIDGQMCRIWNTIGKVDNFVEIESDLHLQNILLLL